LGPGGGLGYFFKRRGGEKHYLIVGGGEAFWGGGTQKQKTALELGGTARLGNLWKKGTEEEEVHDENAKRGHRWGGKVFGREKGGEKGRKKTKRGLPGKGSRTRGEAQKKRKRQR